MDVSQDKVCFRGNYPKSSSGHDRQVYLLEEELYITLSFRLVIGFEK